AQARGRAQGRDGVDGVAVTMEARLRSPRHAPEPPMPRELPVVRSPYEDPELYDLLFDGYQEDVAVYLAKARATDRPVTHLACGPGRLLTRAVEAGVDVEGREQEPAMLARLTRKARERGLEPRVHPGDMRSLSLPRRYALIYCAFNTLVHNLTPEDWIATLSG